MFETLSHAALQEYWWGIASLMAGLLVFLLFVQGGQTMLRSIGGNEEEMVVLTNSLGRKWEFTFTTLVTFGGVMFAAFPKFYAVSFGGAYWVWICILLCFTIQAISYEFRRKQGNVWGPRTYEAFLFINGSLGVFLIGTAVGTFFTGSAFSLDTDQRAFWQNPWHGLEALIDVRNILLGFVVFFLARILGALYFMNNIGDITIIEKARRMVRFNAVPFVAVFVAFAVMLFVSDGYAVEPGSGVVSLASYKYLNNFLEMPLVLSLFLAGVLALLTGIGLAWFRKQRKAIWIAGPGTILTVFSLFLVAGLNHTAFYPSNYDLQSSLTVGNSSSSRYTLTVMSYVSLFVPFVLAYIWYVWRTLDKKKIDKEEMKGNEHIY